MRHVETTTGSNVYLALDAVNEATKLATEEAQEEAKEGMEDGTRIGRSRVCMKCRGFPAELAVFSR